jgi:hypothetical protein
MDFAFQLATGIIIAAAIIELFRRGARMLSEDAEFERGKASHGWIVTGVAVLLGACVIWITATDHFAN